jgi:hypothetical protein
MLTKHDERKMPRNLGHIESLARSYTDTAIKTLAGIMMEPSAPARARSAAAAILRDRGFPGGDAAGDQRAARAFHSETNGLTNQNGPQLRTQNPPRSAAR